MGRKTWCLGQAFLTRSTVGGESTGRSKKGEQEGAARLLERRGEQLGQESEGNVFAPMGLASRADGSLDTHS